MHQWVCHEDHQRSRVVRAARKRLLMKHITVWNRGGVEGCCGNLLFFHFALKVFPLWDHFFGCCEDLGHEWPFDSGEEAGLVRSDRPDRTVRPRLHSSSAILFPFDTQEPFFVHQRTAASYGHCLSHILKVRKSVKHFNIIWNSLFSNIFCTGVPYYNLVYYQ